MFRSKSLVTINEPTSMATESYKMLRTNLHYMNLDKFNQVILFTSSFTEEGKTTSVVNTGITYAQADQKVLIIECDLRKARVHELFNIQAVPGLTSCLVDNMKLEDAIQVIDEVPNLHVLTAGALPPNPAEMLGSRKMAELLSYARSQYDIVIIDSPPVLSVADALVLSKLVDGIVLVVATHITRTEELKRAKKALDNVKANLLGCLMTKAEIKNKRYYAYYGDGKDNKKKKK